MKTELLCAKPAHVPSWAWKHYFLFLAGEFVAAAVIGTVALVGVIHFFG